MQGKGFLKVCGIIMIVFAGIGILTNLFTGVLGAMCASVTGGEIGGKVIIASLIGIVACALELVCGIVGVKNCDKPEMADHCFQWGCIVAGCQLVSLIVGAILSGFSIMSLIGFVLPGLFIYGAILNKKG